MTARGRASLIGWRRPPRETSELCASYIDHQEGGAISVSRFDPRTCAPHVCYPWHRSRPDHILNLLVLLLVMARPPHATHVWPKTMAAAFGDHPFQAIERVAVAAWMVPESRGKHATTASGRGRGGEKRELRDLVFALRCPRSSCRWFLFNLSLASLARENTISRGQHTEKPNCMGTRRKPFLRLRMKALQ